ncbi:MAG: dTDP-4-dehydrorhamnose reductase [Flavobacterium sp.]|nr:dTDP-4-dehydrorhamnose reductase [Flavobacterium sp.]
MVVLVLGGSGQAGQAINHLAIHYPEICLVFKNSVEADVTDITSLQRAFATEKPDYCINAAAYTAVDKAETESEIAFAINAFGAANVAEVCKLHDVVLLQISTDYVFDGTKELPYVESDRPNPCTVYGKSKLQGEIFILQNWHKHFIIRISWLYSEFGTNFMLTMLKLAGRGQPIKVVNDQIGTPTHALDLARALIGIIKSGSTEYGIYHFSNEGTTSWFDFASEIFNAKGVAVEVTPVSTEFFPSIAQRPRYSVLDKTKIKNLLGVEIANWRDALHRNH